MSEPLTVIEIPPDAACDEFDYKGFMQDFRIADRFGADAIKDTYSRAFGEWKNDVKYFASFVLTLNHQIWHHHGNGNEELANLYDTLWKQADSWGCEHFTGDDLAYYYDFLD